MQLLDQRAALLDELRIVPVRKWVRATVEDRTIVDTRRARLVWEPRRIVSTYAVPETDLAAQLRPSAVSAGQERPVQLEVGPPVLDPSSPFGAHTADGTVLDLHHPAGVLAGAAFRPSDSDLAGYMLLDWDAFTAWFEEDAQQLAHPRDPFSRIDCLPSSRHVVIAHHGVLFADSSRPTMLFETLLPPRFYLPRDDVALELLTPTDTSSQCAYKGVARYWSAQVGEELLTDIAWSYELPLNDAVPVRGLISFFTERLDVTVDGEPQPRPRTPWS